MDSHDHSQDLKNACHSASVIFFAIIASLIIYVVIAELLRTQFKPFVGFVRTVDFMIARYAVSFLAVLTILAVRFMQRPLLRERPGETPRDFIHLMGRAAIVSAALCETPGLLGFILFLMTGSHLEFLVLVFVSIFLAFMYFPRKYVWETRLRIRFPGLING